MSKALQKMQLANDLVVDNLLFRHEILERTGYGSWRSLQDAVRTYRKRQGLPTLQHAHGWLKVASHGDGRVRVVLCGDAIQAAGWQSGTHISWRVKKGEIRLSSTPELTREKAFWTQDDPDADVYWEHYAARVPWRTIAKQRHISMTTAIAMAERHAQRHPSIPFGQRPTRAAHGEVTVMEINNSTLRLNLDRAARLARFKAADQVQWRVESEGVLVLRKIPPGDSQAST